MPSVKDNKQHRNEVKNESALPQAYSSKGTTVHSLEHSLSVISVHFTREKFVLHTVMYFVLSLVHIS